MLLFVVIVYEFTQLNVDIFKCAKQIVLNVRLDLRSYNPKLLFANEFNLKGWPASTIRWMREEKKLCKLQRINKWRKKKT